MLSLVGLRRTQRHGTRGRGLAIAGIVISSVWFAYIAVVVTLGVIIGVTSAAPARSSATTMTSGAGEARGDDTDHTSAADMSGSDAYLADLESKAEDTYRGYPDESLIDFGQYACDALGADGDVDTASHNTAFTFGLTADDTGAVLGAAVLDLCPQFTPLVQRATGNPNWGA